MSVRWSFEYTPDAEQARRACPILFTVSMRPSGTPLPPPPRPDHLNDRFLRGTLSGASTSETNSSNISKRQQQQQQQQQQADQQKSPRVRQQERRRKLETRLTRRTRSQVLIYVFLLLLFDFILHVNIFV
jgi:hypothetical protein